MASGIRPWASQIAEAIEGWERWPDLYRKLVIAQKKALAAHQKPRKQLHSVMPGRRRILSGSVWHAWTFLHLKGIAD